MKIFKHKKMIIYFLIIFAPVVWWNVNYPSGSWRYKITVEVETPEGIKHGSAVREFFFGTAPTFFPEESGFGFWTHGEAVAVDLGKRGVLYVLMGEKFHYAFPNPYYMIGRVEEYWPYIRYYNALPIGQQSIVPEEHWPKMVMFKDIHNLKSLVLAYGYEFDVKTQKEIKQDNILGLFGEGVKISRIVYEITDEEVTRNVIDQYLPKNYGALSSIWRELSSEQASYFMKLKDF